MALHIAVFACLSEKRLALGFRAWPMLEVSLSAVVSVFGFFPWRRGMTLSGSVRARGLLAMSVAREVDIDLADV